MVINAVNKLIFLFFTKKIRKVYLKSLIHTTSCFLYSHSHTRIKLFRRPEVHNIQIDKHFETNDEATVSVLYSFNQRKSLLLFSTFYKKRLYLFAILVELVINRTILKHVQDRVRQSTIGNASYDKWLR